MSDRNPAREPTDRIRRMQMLALVLLVIGGIVNYLDRSALAVANVEIRQELGLSATSMGVLLSAFLLAYAFAQIFVGISIDRLGPRVLLGIGMMLWSAAQAVSGMVAGFTQFYLARIVLGIGEAAQFPTGIRVVNNWFHITRRGLPTGIFNCSSFLGTALAPPLLTVIMLAAGWRIMFVVMGLVGIGAAALWIRLYRDPEVACSTEEVAYIRSGDTERTSSPVSYRQWGRLFRYSAMWGAILGTMGSQYLMWMYFTWLPGFLEIQQHVSIGRTGLYAAIPAIAGVIGSIAGGGATDWLAHRGFTPLACRKIPLVSGLIGMAAVTIATAYASDNAVVIFYISVAYFLGGLSSAAIWAIVTAAAPPDYVGSFGSILLIGGYLGAACSPIVTGFVVDRTGSFLLALLIGAAMALLGAAAFLLMIRRPISGAELDDKPVLAVEPPTRTPAFPSQGPG
jgi:MFS family permease